MEESLEENTRPPEHIPERRKEKRSPSQVGIVPNRMMLPDLSPFAEVQAMQADEEAKAKAAEIFTGKVILNSPQRRRIIEAGGRPADASPLQENPPKEELSPDTAGVHSVSEELDRLIRDAKKKGEQK